MSRLDAGNKMFLLCGYIFLAVALIFLLVCGVFIVQINTFSFGYQEEKILPILFGGISMCMAGLGTALLVWVGRKKKEIDRLIAQGKYVMADVIGVLTDYQVTINWRPTYRVECSYVDPRTNMCYIFRSQNLFQNIANDVIGAKVRVYIDQESRYQNYYVDVNSLLI